MTPCASPFVTAWPVNAELAASSGSKPGFVANMSRSPAFRLSTSALATKALAPSSTSARPADQPSTTSREGLEEYLAIPVGAFADPSFPRRSSPSTSLECIAGSFLRRTPSTSHERAWFARGLVLPRDGDSRGWLLALRRANPGGLPHRPYSYVMRPLRYSINVTLDGCCDHRAILRGRRLASSRDREPRPGRCPPLWPGDLRNDGDSVAGAGADGSEA